MRHLGSGERRSDVKLEDTWCSKHDCSLGQRWIEGPGHVRLDMNIVKRVRIDESKHFEIGMDVRNILNTPWWADPDTNINSLNFGRMVASGTSGSNNADINTGARSFTINARVNF
jgi:hypothetical protein